MDKNVGSIVYFTDSEIQVFVMSNADTEYDKIYGYCILLSEYFSNLYSTVTMDKVAKRVLIDALDDVDSYAPNLEQLVQAYGEFNKLDSVKLAYELSRQQPKKHCSFIIRYNLEGNYAPNFRASGFGLLGKNVEISSVTACFATLSYMLNEYQDNEIVQNLLEYTVRLTGSNIAKYPKLGIKNEIAVVRTVMEEVGKQYRHYF